MTAIGKLLAVLTLVAGLGILTWSVGVYAQRPSWFVPAGEGDRGGQVTFAQLKAETDSLGRAAGVASAAWGAHLKLLDEREKYRADRKAAYAERLRWAQKGNPKDPIEPGNPKSPGKGFYEPVIDPATKLHDLSLVGGVPRGRAAVGGDGNPLPGLEGLLDSLGGDVTAIQDLNAQILAGRKEYDKLSGQVAATEIRALKMGVIRDSVTAELFYLSTFEVNVFETRATVFRREKQLRNALKVLGINDP